VLDGLRPAIWPEGRVEDHLLSSAPEVSSQDRALRALWEHRWGLDPEDVGNLRPNSDRWVRFHSLPGSKQYADDEAEYQEILRRHRVLLEELASGEAAGTRLVVVGSWSTTPVPAPLDAVSAGALPGRSTGGPCSGTSRTRTTTGSGTTTRSIGWNRKARCWMPC